MKVNKDNPTVGLIVLKGEPITSGHHRLFFRASAKCDIVIIVFGSSNQPVSPKHPFSLEQRKEMLSMLLGPLGKNSKYKCFGVNDIGNVSKEKWANYVMSKIKANSYPIPTEYFAGSVDDGDWFDALNENNKTMNINVVNREDSHYMSGTQVRKSLMEGGIAWKDHVPLCLVDYIENNFPEELLLKNAIKIRRELAQDLYDSDVDWEDLLPPSIVTHLKKEFPQRLLEEEN